MGKTKVTPRAFLFHPVTIAISKARSLAWVLERLGDPGSPDIHTELRVALDDAPAETLEYLHETIADALTAALDEAEQAFRESLTPEQAEAQVIAGPKAAA